jgi:3-deoxy-7-phosphoheptulonate synthase
LNTDATAGDRSAVAFTVVNPYTTAVLDTLPEAAAAPVIGCGGRSEMMSLLPASVLLNEIPISAHASNQVAHARTAISRVIAGLDPRLVVVVGPCSIHDVFAAFEYGIKLKALADRYSQQLIVVMRTYCEKPRTSVGWKGLIPDPDLNGTHRINKGLRMARRLILELNDMGLPTATEFLDLQIPQYLGDLTSWATIGARTTESQVHRELASGLPMPVGFKNGTDGGYQTAVDAVVTARSSHCFPSVDKHGIATIVHTTGNRSCHVILRGGTRTGPNFDTGHVADVGARLTKAGLPESVMIDCSHANCGKDHTRQKNVVAAICDQISQGSSRIFGAMIESNLVEGRQEYIAGRPAVYGQSITDACVSIHETERLLEQLATAQERRSAQ